MIIRLWVLAWAARYLKYVPILGWRFSDRIGRRIEDRMDRDVDVDGVDVEFEDETSPTAVHVTLSVTNELPVDLTIYGVNIRIGYAEDAETLCNLLWSEETHGQPPKNLSRELIESGDSATVSVERYLPGDAAADTLHVDGTLTTRAWLDLPSTKRVPLGTLACELPGTDATIPS